MLFCLGATPIDVSDEVVIKCNAIYKGRGAYKYPNISAIMHFNCTIAEEWYQVNHNMRPEKRATGHCRRPKAAEAIP
jgi:hypothetical protein